MSLGIKRSCAQNQRQRKERPRRDFGLKKGRREQSFLEASDKATVGREKSTRRAEKNCQNCKQSRHQWGRFESCHFLEADGRQAQKEKKRKGRSSGPALSSPGTGEDKGRWKALSVGEKESISQKTKELNFSKYPGPGRTTTGGHLGVNWGNINLNATIGQGGKAQRDERSGI